MAYGSHWLEFISFCKLVGIVVGLSFVDYYYQTLPQVKHLESGHFCRRIPLFAGTVQYDTVAALMDQSFHLHLFRLILKSTEKIERFVVEEELLLLFPVL